MGTAAIVIGAVVAVAGAVEQRKAGKQAEKAADKEEEANKFRARRERTAQLRRSIRQRARVRNAAEATGGGESSLLEGTVAGITSQASTNIGAGLTLSRLSEERVSFLNSASRLSGRAALFSTVGGVVGGPAGQKVGTLLKKKFDEKFGKQGTPTGGGGTAVGGTTNATG